jgi:hypothetical protein
MPFPLNSNSESTAQGHGIERHANGTVCVNQHQTSRDGMWATCPRLASSVYHADIHEGHGTVGEWQGRGMACVN